MRDCVVQLMSRTLTKTNREEDTLHFDIYLIEETSAKLLKSISYERCDRLDFWDAQKRASILIQRARFNNTR